MDERNDLSGSSVAFDKLQQTMKDHVLQLRHANESASRPYDSALIPALESPVNNTDPHRIVEVKYKNAEFRWVPQNAGLQKISRRELDVGTASEVVYDSMVPGTFEATAYLNIPENGEYQFTLESNAACFVRLHAGHAFDQPQPDMAIKPISRHLKAGVHPIRISTMSANRPVEITLRWSKSPRGSDF